LGTSEEVDKKLMEDPCLECDSIDKRNLFLEQTRPRLADPNESTGPSLLRQTLEQYQQTHLKYKHFSEATFEAIMIHEGGKIIDVNQQFVDMHGFSKEELQTFNAMELIPPEYQDVIKEKLDSGYEGAYEIVGLRKDGSRFPLEIRAKTIEMGGRQLRFAVSRDITEEKLLKQQLSDSENKYRELYKNARACLYRTRISDGMLLDCSRATARLFGYANEDEHIKNFSVTNTYVDPQQRQALIEALTKDKRVHGFELQLKHKDGTALWVTMSAEIFPEQDFIEGAMRDITVTKVLSQTENDILKLLMQGLSNKEIALKTGRSVRTIEDHRASIMRKLKVDNIVDLTQKALNLPNHHTKE
jgi:PAS domain S-box-containing protein